MSAQKSEDGTTAVEMIAGWLRANGYEGLCCPDMGCGCGLDDLCPCDVAGNLHSCVAAYEGIGEDGDTSWYLDRGDAELSGQRSGCEIGRSW